mmetsp:Transcript_69406/g.184798  ORF Transcript_69406/g.184798 Transcript_69406/m.184798 type:complete len:573 (-) Transcript_69406:118-1836(-)
MVVFLAALLDHVLADPPAPRHGAVDVHRLERFEVLDEAIEQLHRLGVGTALAVVALAQRADHKVDLEHLLLDELGHVVVEHGNAELLCHVVQPRQVEALHDGGGDAQPEDGHLVHLRILEEPHAGQRLVERRHREAHRLDVLVREQELEPRLRDHRLLVGAVDVDGRSVLLHIADSPPIRDRTLQQVRATNVAVAARDLERLFDKKVYQHLAASKCAQRMFILFMRCFEASAASKHPLRAPLVHQQSSHDLLAAHFGRGRERPISVLAFKAVVRIACQENPHHGLVHSGARADQCGFVLDVAQVHVCLTLQEQVDNFSHSRRRGCMQRGPTLLVRLVDRGLVFDEQLDGFQMARPSRPMQRGPTPLICPIHLLACIVCLFEQRFHRTLVAVPCGDHQRSSIGKRGVRAIQQQFKHRNVAVHCCKMLRPKTGTISILICAALQQNPDNLFVAVLRSNLHRGAALECFDVVSLVISLARNAIVHVFQRWVLKQKFDDVCVPMLGSHGERDCARCRMLEHVRLGLDQPLHSLQLPLIGGEDQRSHFAFAVERRINLLRLLVPRLQVALCSLSILH